MQHILKYSVLLATILASCSLHTLVEPESALYKNPHTSCAQCHATEKPHPGSALLKPGTDSLSLCLSCHDYKDNHHPVDFAPADPSTFTITLFNGKVTCLTCHVIHGGRGGEGTPKLLSGGPYGDRRTICFECHYREAYADIDPHIMLTDHDKVNEVNGKPVCLLCHSKKPDPAVDKTNDVRFRADVGFLCWRCHPPMAMPGNFFEKHFLVKPSPETLRDMRETEARLNVILPLVPRGRITCSTCHNPHQKGVIQRDAAAKGSDAAGRLRLPSICIGCHRNIS
jgi:hypothetical protein